MIYTIDTISDFQEAVNNWPLEGLARFILDRPEPTNGRFRIQDTYGDIYDVLLEYAKVYTGMTTFGQREIRAIIRVSYTDSNNVVHTETYDRLLLKNLAYYIFGRPDMIPDDEYLDLDYEIEKEALRNARDLEMEAY